MDHLGERVVAALGPAAAGELIGVLERSDADRAALIGRLHVRDDAAWLAELLIDLEVEEGEIARLQIVDGLRRAVGGSTYPSPCSFASDLSAPRPTRPMFLEVMRLGGDPSRHPLVWFPTGLEPPAKNRGRQE